jgi:predicted metal-dependent peptidase
MEIEEKERAVKTALRYTVSKSPGFAAIALWCPYVITEGHFVARTDGRSIQFGAHYFQYTPLEQAAILVHEILHVALRHIPRARKGHVDMLLWNLCTDAIINETISQATWLELPPDGVRLTSLLTWEEMVRTPAHQWTSETLYQHLLANQERLGGILASFGMDLQQGDEEAGEPLEEKIWGERLKRASMGDHPGGLIRTIGQDFPVDTIPWEKVLRRLMTQPLLMQTKVNWNRPSRKTLSLGSEFFEPGIRPQDGLPMAGVVLDTSGSIDEGMLTRFAREVQGIQQRTGCSILLISADAEVQTEQVVRNDGKSLMQKIISGRVQVKGGGGTDFYPALQRMKEKKVRVLVYLTDLYGHFGEETHYPFPIIWATTSKGEQAPFGTTLSLA